MLSPQVCSTLISSRSGLGITPLSVSGVTHHTYLAANNIYCSRDIGYSDTGASWKNCFSVDFPPHSDHDYNVKLSEYNYDAPSSHQVWAHPPVSGQHPGEAGYGQTISEEETSDCGQASFDETIQSIAIDTMSQLDIVSHAFYKSVFTDSYEAGEEAGGTSGLDNPCNLDLVAASCSDGEYHNLLK